MRAARSVPPTAFSPVHVPVAVGNDALTVLAEIVAQLAERVEVLEARERITRVVLCPPRSRRRKSS